MTEAEKLIALREKLVARRRALVESFRRASPEQLTGDAMTRIQSAIDAVDRAIEGDAPRICSARRSVPALRRTSTDDHMGSIHT